MSSQRGNVKRTRPQKYQNKTQFKNDLHDTSHIIKNINKLEVVNVCTRCKDVIEWKIKFKKYKPLKNPLTCVNCHCKTVKHPYHTLCINCASEKKACPKCGQVKELVESKSSKTQEDLLKCSQVKALLQELTERKRRMFHRLVQKGEEDLNTEEKIIKKLEILKIASNESTISFNDLSDCDSSDSNIH